jgi:hypothetical protein
MALYAGVAGLYKTASGYVPAVTTAHRSSATAAATDITVATATHVDIITLGYQPTRIASVPKGAGTDFASRLTNDTGSFWIPA